MECSLHERPISYGSTGSSASSRDRHCSLGGRAVSTPERDQDSGAIRLELVPARQLEEAETGRRTPAPTNQEDADGGHPGEGRKVPYVDRVVQEILETEKTYVQDLQSIVQVRGREGGIGWWTEPGVHREKNIYIQINIYSMYVQKYINNVCTIYVYYDYIHNVQCIWLGIYVHNLQNVQIHFLATLLQKESERHTVVQEAIDTMQRVAWHINDMKRKYENTVRLQVRHTHTHTHTHPHPHICVNTSACIHTQYISLQ
uniref:DH domain-containing protein n=1 Tax=Electrophorus electricus TaxID=8005 RepID=A0AAY5EAR9_ELEEL